MTLIDSVLLGLTQGLTEFLPISSSGHLVILSSILNIESDLIFDLWLHSASLIAVVVYFRESIMKMCYYAFQYLRGKPKSKEATQYTNLILFIILATIPAGLIGYGLSDSIENAFNSVTVVGISLILTGIMIYVADTVSLSNQNKTELTKTKSIVIGLAQTIAIFPGISRSGFTISAGLLCGLPRKKAAEFSFLLAIPTILGAIIFKFNDITMLTINSFFLITAWLTAFIFSLISIHLFLKMITNLSIKKFSYYCLAIGITIILLK